MLLTIQVKHSFTQFVQCSLKHGDPTVSAGLFPLFSRTAYELRDHLDHYNPLK